MNLERINKATECIESNSKALQWLQNNKERLINSGLFTVKVSISSNFAHTGTGVNEALQTISAFAKHNIEKTINDSISNCINTIEIEREAILMAAGHAALAQEVGGEYSGDTLGCHITEAGRPALKGQQHDK